MASSWKQLHFAFPQLMLVLQEFGDILETPADVEFTEENAYWQYQELKFTLRFEFFLRGEIYSDIFALLLSPAQGG
jgi:hypothetical protein